MVQQTLLVKCAALSQPSGKTGEALLNLTIEWGNQYNECAARHNGLVDAITPAGREAR